MIFGAAGEKSGRKVGRFLIAGWLSLALFLGVIPLAGQEMGELPAANATAAPRPNILLVLFDDLGLGDLGWTGQRARAEAGLPAIETPNLDALAARSLRFTQAYASDPVCAPTRCSLMTGRDQGHAVVRDNWEGSGLRGPAWGPDAWEGQFPLPPGTVTLASALRDAGYRTGGFGKWGLGSPLDGGHPLDLGFDHFTGYLCQRQAHNYYPDHLWRDRQRLELRNPYFSPHQTLADGVDAQDPASYAAFSGPDYAPDVYFEDAKAFIRDSAQAGQPFFCYFPTVVPHVALQVPEDEPSLAGYRQKIGAEDPYRGHDGYLPNRTPQASYAAMITRADRQIGELLQALDEAGVLENTLILVTSDNGPATNGGARPGNFGSAAGLRGAKARVFEGGIRVPLSIAWPGKIAPGETDTVAVTHDLFPTLAELLGLPQPPTEGVSLVPTLAGRAGEQRQPAWRYWELGGAEAVCVGDWKGIRHWKGGQPGPLALFNLESDPVEEHDVAAAHPEVVRQLEEALGQAREAPLNPEWALGAEVEASKAKNYHPLDAWIGHIGQ